MQEPSIGSLRPDADRSLNAEIARDVFVEGDNLEVLKLLQRAYHGKVKMIYIGPPYNTGKEFIYPDNYREGLASYLRFTGQTDEAGQKLAANAETSGRYHSNWLSMMYPRLALALLKSDGVIFMTIDDHEVHPLRLLMDEVFGPENFLATCIWQKIFSPKPESTVLGVGGGGCGVGGVGLVLCVLVSGVGVCWGALGGVWGWVSGWWRWVVRGAPGPWWGGFSLRGRAVLAGF